MKAKEKKSHILFAVSNKVSIFAPNKITKDNENNVSKYILVVAPVTTPTVVRAVSYTHLTLPTICSV